MEECEICGKKSNDIYIVNVEEVELRVCTKCAQGKRIVSKVSKITKAPKQPVYGKKEELVQLVDDYGRRIHDARERMHLPLKVLAEMISEKETYLLHVEQQKIPPSEALRKKLEHALGIKLSEPAQTQTNANIIVGKKENASIGDFLDVK